MKKKRKEKDKKSEIKETEHDLTVNDVGFQSSCKCLKSCVHACVFACVFARVCVYSLCLSLT